MQRERIRASAWTPAMLSNIGLSWHCYEIASKLWDWPWSNKIATYRRSFITEEHWLLEIAPTNCDHRQLTKQSTLSGWRTRHSETGSSPKLQSCYWVLWHLNGSRDPWGKVNRCTELWIELWKSQINSSNEIKMNSETLLQVNILTVTYPGLITDIHSHTTRPSACHITLLPCSKKQG